MRLKYFLFLLLICFSCNRGRQTPMIETLVTFHQEPTIQGTFVYYPISNNRITVNLNNPQEASLFDYFSHIELIPMETNDHVLIGRRVEEIVHSQNKFYVQCSQRHRVFVFDNTGQFLFQINRRGQGPGEYLHLRSIFLNPFTGNIDILCYQRILSYCSLTGEYVKTVNLSEISGHFFWNLIALDETTYVLFTRQRVGGDSYRIHFVDVGLGEVTHREYEDDPFLNSFLFFAETAHTPFFWYNGNWYFYRFVDRVTYRVEADGLVPAFTWDFGRHNFDAGNLPIANRREPTGITSLPWQINNQGQSNRFVIMDIFLTQLTSPYGFVIIHDKAANEAKLIDRWTEGVRFLPRKITNEYVLAWAFHDMLDRYVTEDMLDDANRQRFINLMNARDEENPIIIKYFFKQDGE